MPKSRVVIGPVPSSGDAFEAVLHLHLELLDGGFMTSLGPGFLRRVFRNVVLSPAGIPLMAQDLGTGQVVGYLMGSVDTASLYRAFLFRHAWSAWPHLIPHLAQPRVWRKLFETMLYPARQTIPDLPEAELLDFGVRESHQGSGLAERLFRRFVDELKKQGIQRFRITSGGKLRRAHGFYEKVGAYSVGEIEIHRGESTHVYCYDIPDDFNLDVF